MRPENGPMQFGNDWTGTYLRGDSSLHLSMEIKLLIEELREKGCEEAIRLANVESFANILGKCRSQPKESTGHIQLMKDYKDCLENKQ